MNTVIFVSSQEILPSDKEFIIAALGGCRVDLQFAILETIPASRATRRDITATYARLRRFRQGMHALLLLHQALRTAVERYLDEWSMDLPKGWSLDQLVQSLKLEREIPDDSICIDPCGRDQHKEDLEDWVIDLVLLPSTMKVTL